jgi:hypothetical protein
MVYNEVLADRIRKLLKEQKGLGEKEMFGGVTFMLHRKMCCGVVGNELVVRVGPGRYQEALNQPHARPMDFTGRPLKGFVFVGLGGYKTDNDLAKWVNQATKFVSSLPVKLHHTADG